VVLAGSVAACGVQPATVAPPDISTDPAPVLALDHCPVTGARWGDGFGPRGTGFHSGIDLLIAEGTPVVAVRAGDVRFVANESGGGGNTAYLTADDGTAFQYAHLVDFVGVDRRVTAGEVLGHVGHTGNATTPHLHFGIRLNGVGGTRVDPAPSLRAASC
jgi:murein DD-endopeptidase MepM/ murein hydrolase activator NlpD